MNEYRTMDRTEISDYLRGKTYNDNNSVAKQNVPGTREAIEEEIKQMQHHIRSPKRIPSLPPLKNSNESGSIRIGNNSNHGSHNTSHNMSLLANVAQRRGSHPSLALIQQRHETLLKLKNLNRLKNMNNNNSSSNSNSRNIHPGLFRPESSSLSSSQHSLAETLYAQNNILWERLNRLENQVQTLEETNAHLEASHSRLGNRLVEATARAEERDIRNKALVEDNLSKATQIRMLSQQMQNLITQSSKLKNYLKRTDKHVDTIRDKQERQIQSLIKKKKQKQKQQEPLGGVEDSPTSPKRRKLGLVAETFANNNYNSNGNETDTTSMVTDESEHKNDSYNDNNDDDGDQEDDLIV